MATFVLVHGAWAGGWAWKRVAPLLRAQGHDVFTPTLTGLGERVHLANPQVNLDTHIQDVVNLLLYEDLENVVLVGWSYGGMVSRASWIGFPSDSPTWSISMPKCRATASQNSTLPGQSSGMRWSRARGHPVRVGRHLIGDAEAIAAFFGPWLPDAETKCGGLPPSSPRTANQSRPFVNRFASPIPPPTRCRAPSSAVRSTGRCGAWYLRSYGGAPPERSPVADL